MNFTLDPTLLKSLLLLTSVVEARDPYTGGHLWRVGQFTRQLGLRIGLDRETQFVAELSGYLHDLGKISVPDSVLGKPGPLTGDEYAIMKTHPRVGADLLAEHPLAPLVLDAVAYHHERPDGRGYPDSLGEEAPLVARMVGITDAFDAMTSTRPYRTGMPIAKALSIIEAEAGKQFDQDLVASFLEIGRAGGLDHIVGHSDQGVPLGHCPKCGPVIAVPRKQRDGGNVICRSCGALYVLHGSRTQYELEWRGEILGPSDRTFVPDTDQIDDFCRGAEAPVPSRLSVEIPVWQSRHLGG